MNIKFQKHYVTNGEKKARVNYSHFNLVSTGEACVTLYAKSYEDGKALSDILNDAYENNTDSMTDYFELGRARILATSPLYREALKRCAA